MAVVVFQKYTPDLTLDYELPGGHFAGNSYDDYGVYIETIRIDADGNYVVLGKFDDTSDSTLLDVSRISPDGSLQTFRKDTLIEENSIIFGELPGPAEPLEDFWTDFKLSSEIIPFNRDTDFDQ